jgi:hypothetical protein
MVKNQSYRKARIIKLAHILLVVDASYDLNCARVKCILLQCR